MLNPVCVVDGHDVKEPPEAAFVASLFQHQLSPILQVEQTRSKPDARSWSIVWFSGHTTVYSKPGIVSFDHRVGSAFKRVMTMDDVGQLDAKLIVLSACHTNHPLILNAPRRAPWLLTHEGALGAHDSFVHAMSFTWWLLRHVRQDRLDYNAVSTAHRLSIGTASASRWRLHTQD